MPYKITCWQASQLAEKNNATVSVLVDTRTNIRITYDPQKREQALEERGLAFIDAAIVFQGITLEVEDIRKDYGEQRIICFGLLAARMVVVGYTPRGNNWGQETTGVRLQLIPFAINT